MVYLPNLVRWPVRADRARAWFAGLLRGMHGRHEPAHPLDAAQSRMIVVMRCVLSFSALAVIYVDPSEPARLVPLTYASLAGYCLYSAAVAMRCYTLGWRAPARSAHWIDVLFYAWLVSLTEGTASIFFYFFFFAILVAAFSYGHREGVRVTLFSAVCFAATTILYAEVGVHFELNRALIRPVYLATLGYMITYWGGHEVLLKRRLRLLHHVNSLWSPRLGLAHTLGAHLHMLLEFYRADSCVLVVRRPSAGDTALMFAALGDKAASGGQASDLNGDTASTLLALAGNQAVLYSDHGRLFRPAGPRCDVVWTEGAGGGCDVQACARIGNILDTRCFISVPYAERDGTEGRLYLNASRQLFAPGDAEFLVQFAAAMAVVAESVHLMEELISKAAEHERYKVSRDLHDSTIQPYIGLKLGLEGLYREIGERDRVSERVRDLIDMTDRTIHDLRHYADRLRQEKGLPGGFLMAAITEQAERYKRFYGIEFAVQSRIDGQLTGRLAAEVFQMVVEGMSNVLRHAASRSGFVCVSCDGGALRVEIGNRIDDETAAPAFHPRSISERTLALDGMLTVHPVRDGHTVVEVVIPL